MAIRSRNAWVASTHERSLAAIRRAISAAVSCVINVRLVLDDNRHDEEAGALKGGVAERLFARERRSGQIFGPNVMERNGMGRGFDTRGVDRLDVRKVAEQSVQFALQRQHFRLFEFEAS